MPLLKFDGDTGGKGDIRLVISLSVVCMNHDAVVALKNNDFFLCGRGTVTQGYANYFSNAN